MVAEGEQGADGAGGGWRDVVAAGPAGFARELLAGELAQVISRLADGIAVVAGDLPDPGGMLGDGEPARGWGQGERGGHAGSPRSCATFLASSRTTPCGTNSESTSRVTRVAS